MPVYLSADEVKEINQQFLGALAVRDESALLAALTRPLTAAHYQQADLALQAAVLLEGIAQAHPFHDELGQQVVELVVHHMTVDEFAQWLRERLVMLP